MNLTYTRRGDVPVLARGLAVTMLFAALALVPAMAGCAAHQRPRTAQPMAFRHCVVTHELPGFVGCDCLNPLVTWDAQRKRKVVYCDGKVQP
jgi:hypothetical protein